MNAAEQVAAFEAWLAAYDEPEGPDPEEHTDRMARHIEEDADIARLNARMEGLE